MNKSLILVVEDDTSVRNLITTTLKTHEYRYLTAPDGQSAILETSSHNPDIVLLDLGLPDIDGVEIIKKIRTWSNMPIIVISARSEDTDKIDALDAGADDYEQNGGAVLLRWFLPRRLLWHQHDGRGDLCRDHRRRDDGFGREEKGGAARSGNRGSCDWEWVR